MPATKEKSSGEKTTKPRRQVDLGVRLYDLLSELADRNSRPVAWEVRLAIQKHLEEAGMWPPGAETG